jgi:hypothetical protein
MYAQNCKIGKPGITFIRYERTWWRLFQAFQS